MSRRRNRARSKDSSAAPSTVVVAARTNTTGDVHQIASERREARIQQRTATAGPGASEPAPLDPNDPDELHRRAVELREYRMGRGPRPAGFDAPKSVVTAAGTISTTFPVMGMTCRSCEVRIAKHVGRLPNVERVSASAVRGEVTVECSAPVSSAADRAGDQQGGLRDRPHPLARAAIRRSGRRPASASCWWPRSRWSPGDRHRRPRRRRGRLVAGRPRRRAAARARGRRLHLHGARRRPRPRPVRRVPVGAATCGHEQRRIDAPCARLRCRPRSSATRCSVRPSARSAPRSPCPRS